jgi:NADPH2:quinone reductase
MKTNAIRIHEYGGPEKMRWEEIELPPPAPGEVQVRHRAVGQLRETYKDIFTQ